MENEKEKRIGANKREGVRWIRGKKKKESQKEKREENRIDERRKKRGRRGRKGEKRKGGFSRRSDGRISTVRELKAIHATRATICWIEVGERSITGLDLIKDTSEKVDLKQKRFLKA